MKGAAEPMSWARTCLIQAQWFTMILDLGLLILIGFIITVISGSPILYWRTGADTPALTIIEQCFDILLCLIYIIATSAIMFMMPEARETKWSFYHGAVVGYGFPFGLHLIGEASSWFQAPHSPSIAGLSVLSAYMGGMALCASFVYWMMLSPPHFRSSVNNRNWIKEGQHISDVMMVTLLSILTLVSAACMLWIIEAVQSQQAFAMIINTAAYVFVLAYLYLVKVNYFTSFMALGALAGAFTAIAIIAAKWTFNFASRLTSADAMWKADLFIVALAFQAGLSLYIIPFLFLWKRKEARLSLKESMRPGAEGYAEHLPA